MSNRHPNASSPLAKLLGQSTRISKKIAKQIIRFHRMSHTELIAHFNGNRFSSFCSLQTPKNELFYGLEGRKLFFELAEALVKYAPELQGRVDLEKIIGAVKKSYVKQFIVGGMSIDNEAVKDMLEYALGDIKLSFDAYKHYIPCVLFVGSSPDEFSVGPVKFVRTSALFSSMVPPGWDTQDNDEALDRQTTIDYYKEYPWVACVEVGLCEYNASFEMAIYACATALNIIRVCLGSGVTDEVRLSTDASSDLKSAKIWGSSSGELEWSHSYKFKSPSGPSNWYESLNEGDGGRIKSFFGAVIEKTCTFGEHSELSGRLIDSVNWFGDACLERSPAASIVKYVTSIERLYLASSEFGVKSRFVNRVSKILSDFELSSDHLARQDASEVYNLRSTLVHGGSSPRTRETLLQKVKAEKLAQGCILCAEQLYLVIFDAFDPKSPEELEAAMRQYDAQGLQWCIDKARTRILSLQT